MNHIYTKRILRSLFFSCLIISSCSKDKAEIFVDYANCDTSRITYCSPIRDILTINCGTRTGCHKTGGTQFSVFNYNAVSFQIKNGNFNNRVFINKSMPPDYSSISATDLQKIQDWLNTGAPER